MRLRSRIATWWKAVTRTNQFNSEIEDELSFHIDACAEDLMRKGVPEHEAFRRARAEVGSIASQKENCRAAWGTRLWDELRCDLRYAATKAVEEPRVCSDCHRISRAWHRCQHGRFHRDEITTAGQIGGTAPGRIAAIRADPRRTKESFTAPGATTKKVPPGETLITSFSYPVYQQLRKQNHVLQDIFAFKNYGRMTATIDEKTEAVTTEMVSGNYYRALEVHPVLGRPILETDDADAGSGPVLIISYGYWSRRFGRSPNVDWKKDRSEFHAHDHHRRQSASIYGHLRSTKLTRHLSALQHAAHPRDRNPAPRCLPIENLWWVMLMGRLKPGVSAHTAQAALNVELNAAIRATMVGRQK